MLVRDHFRDPYRFAIAQASELAAPVLRLVAGVASRGEPTPPENWRTGVILGNGHIGDVLYRTCSLQSLADGLPGCRWTYLTTSVGAATLAGNPALAEILPWTDDTDALDADRRREVKTRAFDVALCSDNVGHHRALARAVRLGIPNRVSFTRKGLSGLATLGVPLAESIPHAAAFRAMVGTITGVKDTSPLRPQIFPTTDDRNAARAEFLRVGGAGGIPLIACAATTRQTIGNYHPDFFADVLARVLALSSEVRIALTGVSTDRPLLEGIASRLGERAGVSAGTLGVLGFGAFLELCSAFLGTDSGARHLANAAGIQVFFVRNMGTTAAETGAYCETETDIAPPGEYLSIAATQRALDTIDRDRVAHQLVTAARKRAHGTSTDTRR